MTRFLLTLLLLGAAGSARGADEYADGWTAKGLEESIQACTDAVVEGAWENTKRAQNIDPAKPLTAEIRKDLAPQIAKFRKLCGCTVKETAKKYGQEAYQRDPDEVGRYSQELVKSGKCKPSQ